MDPLFVREIQRMYHEWDEEDFGTFMNIVEKYGLSSDIIYSIIENYQPDPSWKRFDIYRNNRRLFPNQY